MKRSRFVESSSEALADLAEKAIRDALGNAAKPSVEPWDPEEPKMPKRLIWCTGALAVFDPVHEARPLTTGEIQEVGARYNTLSRVFDHDEARIDIDDIVGLLAEERRDL